MRRDFTSVFSKIGRAEAHYKMYEQETLKWAEQLPTAISLVGNDDGSRYTVMAENIYPPDLERWSLIAADCVHNLRCALDHLVYALAIQDSKIDPPTKKRYLQFPITESESEFATQEFRMAGLNPDSKALIEAAQPYNHRHLDSPAILTVLNDLENTDKHRLLNTAAHYAAGVRITFDPEPVSKRKLTLLEPSPIGQRAEIAYLTFDPPVLDLKCNVVVPLAILIKHVAVPNTKERSPLKVVLWNIFVEVKRIVATLV